VGGAGGGLDMKQTLRGEQSGGVKGWIYVRSGVGRNGDKRCRGRIVFWLGEALKGATGEATGDRAVRYFSAEIHWSLVCRISSTESGVFESHCGGSGERVSMSARNWKRTGTIRKESEALKHEVKGEMKWGEGPVASGSTLEKRGKNGMGKKERKEKISNARGREKKK